MNSLRIQSSWIWGLTLAACGLLHPVAWAAVEGYYLPGKESIEFRYMYDPSTHDQAAVEQAPADLGQWDTITGPDGRPRYLLKQPAFTTQDIEGIVINRAESIPGIDYSMEVRLAAEVWERTFDPVLATLRGKIRPVLRYRGTLLTPQSLSIRNDASLSLTSAQLSPLLEGLVPGPQNESSQKVQDARTDRYIEWLRDRIKTHPEDFDAFSEYMWMTLLIGRGVECQSLVDQMGRFIQEAERRSDLTQDVLAISGLADSRLSGCGDAAGRQRLAELIRISKLPERDRQDTLKGLAEGRAYDAKHPDRVLGEQFLQAITNHQCEQAQARWDEIQRTANDTQEVAEHHGGYQAGIGVCLAEVGRVDDAGAILQRLNASDAPDKREAIRMLEDAITQAKAAPAPASPGATP